jgi:hypothetical protein
LLLVARLCACIVNAIPISAKLTSCICTIHADEYRVLTFERKKFEELADIYFVHDFQLVPLVRLCPWMKPVMWVCHVDTAHPNLNAERYVN